MNGSKKIIFVYNADSGLVNTVVDVAHRLTKPNSYPCRLCAVTYGTFGMEKRWKDFLRQIGIPAIFWHRDEFTKKCKFPNYRVEFPAVIVKENDKMTTIMDAKDFKKISDLDDLVRMLKSRLGEYQ